MFTPMPKTQIVVLCTVVIGSLSKDKEYLQHTNMTKCMRMMVLSVDDISVGRLEIIGRIYTKCFHK